MELTIGAEFIKCFGSKKLTSWCILLSNWKLSVIPPVISVHKMEKWDTDVLNLDGYWVSPKTEIIGHTVTLEDLFRFAMSRWIFLDVDSRFKNITFYASKYNDEVLFSTPYNPLIPPSEQSDEVKTKLVEFFKNYL